MNSDDNILILSADNGNATVFMNKEDYENKMKELLNPTTYKKLLRDPTQSTSRKVIKFIRQSSILRSRKNEYAPTR